LSASNISSAIVKINHDLVRTGKFDLADLETILDNPVSVLLYLSAVLRPYYDFFKDTGERNSSDLISRHILASLNPPIWGHPYAPCLAVHPEVESCIRTPLASFALVFKWTFPIYGALHLIPMMLFKRRDFVKEPLRMLMRAAWGTSRSASFMSMLIVIYQCESHFLSVRATTLTGPRAGRQRFSVSGATCILSLPLYAPRDRLASAHLSGRSTR